jgi:hypothetical protein
MLIPIPSSSATRNRRGELPDFFVSRLQRLVTLHPEHGSRFDAERLLHHAIYSTYVDCRELGLGPEATAIVGPLQPRSVVGVSATRDSR